MVDFQFVRTKDLSGLILVLVPLNAVELWISGLRVNLQGSDQSEPQ